jgi:hypothetical protein
MCTVTLFHDAGELVLTMNRDESWQRSPERPPSLHAGCCWARSWIGPVDGDRGGTWIAVNRAGVAACLLNGYAPGDLELVGRDDVPSRGEIVVRAMDRGSRDALRWAEEELDPSPYPSFVLLLWTPSGSRLLRWTIGSELSLEGVPRGWSMVTSSYFHAEQAERWRAGAFAAWLASDAPLSHGLPDFNILEDPNARELSPFMTRTVSGTRSVTQIRSGQCAGTYEMRYWRRRGTTMIDPLTPDSVVSVDAQPAS